MPVTLYSAQVVKLEAKPIAVEVDISPGLHIFSIVGLADKEIQESRERIGAAIKNLGGLAPHKKSQRVIVNLAPADIRKEGPAFDLPIALGYLLASGQIVFDPEKTMFLGELGLDGKLRKISGILPIALAAKISGFSRIILPKGNGSEAALFEEIEIREAEHLQEVVEHLQGRKELPLVPHTETSSANSAAYDFKEIRGQEGAKRALEIAAAGNHNILMSGPPGAGKTILAKTFASILPPLSFDESLEVTKIYSICGMLDEKHPLVTEPPFRSPHHTASYVSIIGGGNHPRPGEATLAHRGVLFLDEFPEFDRRVLEALREPLEERSVTISRAGGTETFPAHFTLLAAMNPCPCGNFGNPRQDCVCSPGVVQKYAKKISGPLLDRIDIQIELPAVPYDKLEGEEGEPSAAIRARVEHARGRQKKRFKNLPLLTNSEMGLKEIKQFITIDSELLPLLRRAHEQYHLSARAYHRVLKLARTIADLADSDEITSDHLMEALRYRPRKEL